MKHFTLTFALLIAFFCGFSQFYAINLDANKTTSQIQRNDFEKLNMSFSYEGINSFNVKTVVGEFSEISIPGTYSIGELGTPKLPATKKLLSIPFGADVTVKVVNFDKETYSLKDYGINNKLMPNQPSISKSQSIEDVKFEYNAEMYAKNAYTNHDLATIEVLGTLRGVRIARLDVAPVRYNPVTDEITVYNNIEVEVTFTNADIAKTKEMRATTYSPYFDVVYNKLFNWDATKDSGDGYPEHPNLTKNPIKYLVVSDRMFEETLQPFLDWKTKQGFEIILAYTDEIGTTYNEIETWVHDQYNNADGVKPSFLLLVGDSPQIPMKMGSESSKYTDLYYGSVDGDYFPEMYYGRFSARTLAHLEAQIEKTLYYEQYQFEDPSYLDRVTLIAGADGTWNPRVGQPTVQYGVDNYFNAEHGYSNVNAYYDSYTGCYATIDEGLGFINYTAHCNETVWGTPELTISDVNSLTNENMYPLAMGNCCLANNIGSNSDPECIGETWMRKEKAGAVAYIGSAPSSYWFEDFYFAVGAFPIQGDNDGYVPTTDESTMGAYDAMFLGDYECVDSKVFIGNLAVTEVHTQGYPSHSSPTYYWQAYMCNGDPSLMMYNTQGVENDVTHLPTLPIGMDTYEVSADPGSYIGISKDGVLLGSALVDESGSVDVPINPVTSGGDVDIVVTGRQKIPYMVQIPAASLDGPYLTLESFEINDPNDNQLLESGENFTIHTNIKNVGSDESTNIVGNIEGDDQYFELQGDNNITIDAINANQVISISDAFAFTLADNVPDQHKAEFQLHLTDASNENWMSKVKFTANAPVMEMSSVNIIPNTPQDNNVLDAGESTDISIGIQNIGHADANSINISLTSLSDNVTIDIADFEIGSIAFGGEENAIFHVNVSNDALLGEVVNFELTISTGAYVESRNFSLPIGILSEDFESGDFQSYDWELSGTADWTITNAEAYEGEFCAESGLISHNQSSILEMSGNVQVTSNISFYAKISSESNYDKLIFSIDGGEINNWSGERNWFLFEVEVEPGEHTFTWEYNKDGSMSSNDDKVWIDNIVFPTMSIEGGTLNASIVASDNEICQGNDVTLSAFVSGGEGEYTYSWTPADAVDNPNDQSTVAHIDETTMFTLEVSDGNNTVESTKTIVVNPIPNTPEVHVSSLNTLMSSEAEGYQWYNDETDEAIYGAINQTFVIEESGMYSVMINDANGCLSERSNSYGATINIDEIIKDNAKMYPNPFNNKTTIEYNLDNASDLKITLMNSLGEIVEVLEDSSMKESGVHTYDVFGENLTEGVYFVLFQQNNTQFTKKLVLVK